MDTNHKNVEDAQRQSDANSREAVRDVTELKRIEERNQQLAAIVEASDDAIFSKTLEGVITSWNKGAELIYGYTPQEVIGKPVSILISPEHEEETRSNLARVREGGRVLHYETMRRRKNGKELWVSLTLSPVKDAAGNVIAVSSVERDVTGRRWAERALQRQDRTLRTLSGGNMALVRAGTEPGLLSEMCRVGVDLGGYRLVWIGFAEHDEAKTVRPVAWAGEHLEYVQTANITWAADTERGRGLIGTAIRTGEAQISQNAGTDPAIAPWRAALAEFGFKAGVALPLEDNTGVFGVITLYAGEADAFDTEEVDLLKELASNLAFGIQALRDRVGRETALSALDKALKSTVQAVAGAVEMHDVYTAGHQRHVAELAAAIAREIGLTEGQIEGIFLAGMIHDVGKLNVPAEFLSKPGKLTSLEYQVIQTHAQSGYDIIKDVDFPWPVAQSILQHHERLDGAGYPNRLKGEAISIEGRILAVADVVDSMQSHRPYRPALGLDAALAEIEAGKGRLYDPAVVDACIALFRQKGFKFY